MLAEGQAQPGIDALPHPGLVLLQPPRLQPDTALVLNIQGDALTVSNGTTRVVVNGTDDVVRVDGRER